MQEQATQRELDILLIDYFLDLSYSNEGVMKIMDMKKTGKKIAKLRKEKQFTQMGVADQLGVTYQAISN
ncbi:helix-turn-helix domain-containing protein [Cytobacillus purgationiresistens]|nr:helix-turn-helix transcriptional regulator [Cytobacillus purgationiresistens]